MDGWLDGRMDGVWMGGWMGKSHKQHLVLALYSICLKMEKILNKELLFGPNAIIKKKKIFTKELRH